MKTFFAKTEVKFLIKFIAVYAGLYLLAQFIIGIASPGNYYSKFCDDYLNIIEWLRLFILKGAAFLCHILGYNAVIEESISLRVINSVYKVRMVYSCIGVGILSCWVAFTIAYPAALKLKIIWLIAGCATICLINMIRVAALLILINKYKSTSKFYYHHEVFNFIAYALVIGMIYLYTKNNTKEDATKS